jgi:hypothetical protein
MTISEAVITFVEHFRNHLKTKMFSQNSLTNVFSFPSIFKISKDN